MKIRIPMQVTRSLIWFTGIAALVPVQAETLGTYSFGDVIANTGGTTDPTAPPSYPGLGFSSFSASGLGASSRANGAWTFSSWSTAETPDLGKYLEFTLSPNVDHAMALDELSFSVRRSSSGPQEFSVRSSLDGFGSNLPGQITGGTDLSHNAGVFQFTADVSHTANVPGSSVGLGGAGGANPVSFRIYGYAAESGAGTFGVDDVAIAGSVTPVPEPEEYAAMFASGLGAFAWWRKRRLAMTAAAA